MSMVWKQHELKPLDIIIKEYTKFTHNKNYQGDRYDFPNEGWTINETMSQIFGDGKLHSFRKVHDDGYYTHKCKDGYYYSEKWFMESLPILEFDEKEFLI